jgi:hypothetical protein
MTTKVREAKRAMKKGRRTRTARRTVRRETGGARLRGMALGRGRMTTTETAKENRWGEGKGRERGTQKGPRGKVRATWTMMGIEKRSLVGTGLGREKG